MHRRARPTYDTEYSGEATATSTAATVDTKLQCQHFPYELQYGDETGVIHLHFDADATTYLELTHKLIITHEETASPTVVGKATDEQIADSLRNEDCIDKLQPLDVSDVIWAQSVGLHIKCEVVYSPVHEVHEVPLLILSNRFDASTTKKE